MLLLHITGFIWMSQAREEGIGGIQYLSVNYRYLLMEKKKVPSGQKKQTVLTFVWIHAGHDKCVWDSHKGQRDQQQMWTIMHHHNVTALARCTKVQRSFCQSRCSSAACASGWDSAILKARGISAVINLHIKTLSLPSTASKPENSDKPVAFE